LALALLGWTRARAHDHAQAEQYLGQCGELNRLVGSDLVATLRLGGLGHLYWHQHRYGSALRSIEEAVLITERMGDKRAEVRWRYNAHVAAYAIGDVASMVRHRDATAALLGPGTAPELQHKVRGIDADIFERTGDLEAAVEAAEYQSRQAEEVGHHGIACHAKIDVNSMRLEQGRASLVLDLAWSLVARAERLNYPPLTRLNASAYLGAVLVATGSPEAGLKLLREATSASQHGVVFPTSFLYWHHRAACMLGLEQEAAAITVRARSHVETVRSDLTDEQWATALANASGLRRLASMGTDGPW
jgi:hypothetical protein